MFAAEIFDRLSAAGWIPALLMRLFVGYFFMETGWGKIHNLEAFTTRFAQWGIPHPAFNAALSAYTEFLGSRERRDAARAASPLVAKQPPMHFRILKFAAAIGEATCYFVAADEVS